MSKGLFASSFDTGEGFNVDNGTLSVENTGTQTLNLSWLLPSDEPYVASQMNYQAQFFVEMQTNASTGLVCTTRWTQPHR